MRSAEQSGAGAEGFGAGQAQSEHDRPMGRAAAPHASATRFKLSPITAAVALTSLLAATLFSIYDSARTLDDVQRELSMVGAAVAADIAEVSPETAQLALESSVRRYASVAKASLLGGEPTAVAPALFARVVPAGSHGSLSLEASQTPALTGMAMRGSIAFGLAGLITLLVAFRRRPAGMPDLLQRQNYQTLAGAIPMGVACWTRLGELIVCNDRYRDRLKLTGVKVSYHDAVKRLIARGNMKLVSEDEHSRVLELHGEDGTCLLIDERPLDDGAFMTLVSDITERKRTDTLLTAIREEQRHLARRYHEEKLRAEAASHAKTNFLAHLSHDIRTPLNHIIGFAELMRHQTYGPLGDARYADYVNSIKSSGEHLLASFATILDLAELEGGRKELRSEPVSVDALLDGVVQRFKGQAQRAGLTFALRQGCGAVVSGDRLGLQRMVGNIVENAIRFTPARGRITLAAFAASDGVVIEITDTGIGMDEERLASLSQPFALGDATFTRDGVGPGLGISIARAIAELSGGRLAIDSSPSLGTTVAISLPAQMANQMLEAAA
jgi:two-component system cell cycle sensor histidine kinase PleC